tara:strand:- start:21 stop:221 length:201 start_codon:yes stop_codon:yes gene_type:complete
MLATVKIAMVVSKTPGCSFQSSLCLPIAILLQNGRNSASMELDGATVILQECRLKVSYGETVLFLK